MKDIKDYLFESSKSSAIADAVKQAMEKGYLSVDDPKTHKVHKYGVSKQNIYDVDMDITYEELDMLIKKYQSQGIKWKYKTDKEWQDDGLEDPNED